MKQNNYKIPNSAYTKKQQSKHTNLLLQLSTLN